MEQVGFAKLGGVTTATNHRSTLITHSPRWSAGEFCAFKCAYVAALTAGPDGEAFQRKPEARRGVSTSCSIRTSN